MKMERRKFRIGSLAQRLNVERFVIRFWEQEFNVSSDRSPGRQRYYSEEDVAKFVLIKDLLYQKGFTIAGAKRELSHLSCSTTKIIASQRTSLSASNSSSEQASTTLDLKKENERLWQQINELQKHLRRLQQLL